MKPAGPSIEELQKLVTSVIEISAQASASILEIYNTDFSVQNKKDNSPLTEADLASHRTICKGLQEIAPDIPILSEESIDLPYQERKQWHSYWLVDPLDGTREFVKRNDEFTVNIALINDGKPILGVVHVPVTGVCYFASKDSGAFKTELGKQVVQIHSKQSAENKLVIAGSRSHGNTKQKKFFSILAENTEIIAMGSSLKLCLVAEGKADLYPRFGPTSEWDTAAAQCVVEEAGGLVTDSEINPIVYNTKDSLLNPDFMVIADSNFDWRPYLKQIYT